MSLVELHATRFAHPALAQEREVIAVEALSLLGHKDLEITPQPLPPLLDTCWSAAMRSCRAMRDDGGLSPPESPACA